SMKIKIFVLSKIDSPSIPDVRRHLFHEAPHRSARLTIGQTAQREVPRQISQVEPLANVVDLFAHFVGAAHEHSALVDELFERELLHLCAVPFMNTGGFWISHPWSQAVRLAGRRVIFRKSLGPGRARLARTFTY